MPNILDCARPTLGDGCGTYNSFCGQAYGDAWCAAYISTMMYQSGESAAIGGHKFTAVQQYLDYFRQQGAYQPVSSGYRPQPGDIVIMKTGQGSMGSHVAIVESVNADGSFTTIEGNRTQDGRKQVIRDTYTGNESYISGYGIPQYQNPPQGGGNYSAVTGGNGAYGGSGGNSLGIGTFDFEDYTVQEGDTIESVAQQFGIDPALLAWYNGLNRWDALESGTALKIPQREDMPDSPWDAGTQNISRQHTMTTKVYHPVIKAEFYAEGGMLAVTTDMADQRVYGDREMDFDIISCSTQRSIASDCASLSITLTNRRDWYNILASNDLVIVKMRRPEFGDSGEDSDAALDEEEQEVFLGVIDDVRKSLDFSSGFPRRAVQVTARSMAKAFINFNVGLIKSITVNPSESAGFMGMENGGLTQLAGMNSSQAIQAVWNAFVGRGLHYQFYNGWTLEDCIAYDGDEEHKFEYLIDTASYNSYSGSLWNFIKELSNPPFNESFWEVKNGRETLVHRQSPFDPEDWNRLHRITIRDDDIVTDATGRSDLETYTVFIANLRFLNQDMINYYNPLWYPPYYSKYGIAQLEVTSTYEMLGADNVDGVTEAMRRYSEQLFNWNIKNNVFANGQIVVKGRASYKIGEIVVLEYSGLEFYVEGVAHNFTVYGGWTTTLSVTRGILPEDRFTPPWGMSEEMTSDTMTRILNMASGEEVDWTKPVEITDPFPIQGGGGLAGGGSLAGGSGLQGSVSAGLQNPTTGTHPIPNTFAQSGIVADYTPALRNWSRGTPQNAIYNLWQQAGRQSDGPLMMLNGRYLVATAFPAGYNITIQLSNGQTIQAITMDEKGTDRYNSGSGLGADWGHKYGSGYSLVEFECTFPPRKSGSSQVQSDIAAINAVLNAHGWSGQKVVGITVEGPLR